MLTNRSKKSPKSWRRTYWSWRSEWVSDETSSGNHSDKDRKLKPALRAFCRIHEPGCSDAKRRLVCFRRLTLDGSCPFGDLLDDGDNGANGEGGGHQSRRSPAR
ncbi:hypothetical protein ACFTAO_13390 [Paenibacillus rhizoplanae]